MGGEGKGEEVRQSMEKVPRMPLRCSCFARVVARVRTVGLSHLHLALLQELHLLVDLHDGVLESLQLELERLQVVLLRELVVVASAAADGERHRLLREAVGVTEAHAIVARARRSVRELAIARERLRVDARAGGIGDRDGDATVGRRDGEVTHHKLVRQSLLTDITYERDDSRQQEHADGGERH